MKRTLFPTHAIFYKATLIFSLMLLFQMNSFAQGPKWTTLGNTAATGDFIGPVNFQPLVFRTNNIVRGAFTETGNFQLNNLIGTGNRLLQTDAAGNIIPFNMGTSSQVLYGNGTWGSLPTPPAILWNASGSNIYYNSGNVGVGTASPLYPLDVVGDVRISNNLYVGGGIIITDRVNANAEVVTGKMKADSIVTDSTKGFYGVSKFNGDVKLQNKLSVDGNTTINGSLSAASISTANISATNFDVNNLLSANKIAVYRITPIIGDSVIRLGDSTLLIDGTRSRIYNDGLGPVGSPRGVSIGRGVGPLLTNGTIAYGYASTAIGYNVRTGVAGVESIVLGSGSSVSTYLINNIPNTLMVGFNSNIPTLFVSQSPGTLGTGNVSIGGNTSPTYKFEVDAGNNDAFFLKTIDASKAIVVQSNTTGDINFKVLGNGKVYAREVNIQLGLFPDYVFYKDYKLKGLPEVGDFIKENHHLPNMPSAEEVKKNGIGIGELQLKLLEKVEELTLYLLEQDKKLKQLEQDNIVLKKQVAEFKK